MPRRAFPRDFVLATLRSVPLTALSKAVRPVKQIVAIVKPYLAERVLEGLKRAPLEACSVSEVKGYGRQKSYLDQYGDSEYSLAFLPKVEITLWVDDARAEEIVRRHRRNRPHWPHGRRQDLHDAGGGGISAGRIVPQRRAPPSPGKADSESSQIQTPLPAFPGRSAAAELAHQLDAKIRSNRSRFSSRSDCQSANSAAASA